MQYVLNESECIEVRDYINELLSNGVHTITFEKKDGTHRIMKATRDPMIIGKDEYDSFINKVNKDGTKRKVSNTSVSAFETQILEWRSFIIPKLIRIDDIELSNILNTLDIKEIIDESN